MICEETILNALRDRIGLDAALIGEAALRKTIRARIAACPDPTKLLYPESTSWKELLRTVLVPETWFFRNPEAFDALVSWARSTWFPAHSSPLRVLSLPCATGEEPYSIAMSLLEAGVDPAAFEILAGDIGESFLDKAREGSYGQNSFRSSFNEVPFGAYFERLADGRRSVAASVREKVCFQTLNLVAGEIPKADVIFCRNALIYFDEICQNHVLARLRTALADDGLLFLGPVEPPPALLNGFATVEFPMAFICCKASNKKPIHGTLHVPRPPAKLKSPVRPPAKLKSPVRPLKNETPPPVAVDSAKRVRELADRGDLAEAADMINRLAAYGDPSAELYCLCGTVHEALNRPEVAEQFYRKALFLDSCHTESLLQLGLLLELDGRADAARPFRQRARRQLAL